MCGVHGYLSGEDAGRVWKMADACRHRGPDGPPSVWSDDRVTLGHNLLAIRSPATVQPYESDVGVLSYNGELYYPEVEGNDTLALSALLDRYKWTGTLTAGPAALSHRDWSASRLDGPHALAYYHKDSSTLTLSRDRTGARSLYYAEIDGKLAFSSELRGLVAAGLEAILDPDGVRLFLTLGHVPGPKTILKGVSKLVPGEVRTYSPDSLLLSSRIGFSPAQPTEFSVKELRGKLVETVRRALPPPGVPCGMFLSGGLDSAAVAWAAAELGRPLPAVTARFAHGDECDNAAELAKFLGAEHFEVPFGEADYLPRLADAVRAWDAPAVSRGVPAYVATHAAASRLGWKVVVTGDGGDELLTGYKRHAAVFDPFASPENPLGRWLRLTSKDLPPTVWRDGSSFDVGAYMNSWLPGNVSSDPLQAQLEIENLCHLPEEYLCRNDKFGMWYGMECRSPLLHEPLRSYLLGLPAEDKLRFGCSKWPLRRALGRVLPACIIDKPKTGWAPPFGDWLGGKAAFSGPIGKAIDETVRAGVCPALDRVIDVDAARSCGIKIVIGLFLLSKWARAAGVS